MPARPVPADVYRAAVRLWVGSDRPPDDDHNAVSRWAWSRWPGRPVPKDSRDLAFWVLSIAFQDGYDGGW